MVNNHHMIAEDIGNTASKLPSVFAYFVCYFVLSDCGLLVVLIGYGVDTVNILVLLNNLSKYLRDAAGMVQHP